MERLGLATSDEQARVAAEYFSAIDFTPWVQTASLDP